MKVVILCGGRGTRIRDVAGELPKPMVPIGDYPIVKHIMDIYGSHGFHDFVFCLGYSGWKIKEYFLNYKAKTRDLQLDFTNGALPHFRNGTQLPPWKITLAETGLDSQTGSRVAQIRPYVEGETFMLTYGDGLGNVDITSLLAFHRKHGRLATITSVRPPSRFGELVVDDRRVERFDEKPQTGEGLINGGFFVLEPGVFDYLTADPSCALEKEPLRRLATDGELMTYVHQGFWMPMDTSREYDLLNRLWADGNPPWLQ